MPKLFLVILLVIMQDTVLASQWKPIDVGHPPLMSPHTSPIVFTGGRVFVVNTPSDTVDVIDSGTLKLSLGSMWVSIQSLLPFVPMVERFGFLIMCLTLSV